MLRRDSVVVREAPFVARGSVDGGWERGSNAAAC